MYLLSNNHNVYKYGHAAIQYGVQETHQLCDGEREIHNFNFVFGTRTYKTAKFDRNKYLNYLYCIAGQFFKFH